jgi:hypothetical protein
MSDLQPETIFPCPNAISWAKAPVGAYCLIDHEHACEKVVKISECAAKRLVSDEHLQIDDGERRMVAWLHFPQGYVRCHEAGHLVFGVSIGRDKYKQGGIFFQPYDGRGAEIGQWIKKEPELVIGLSLAGILSQLELADYSFHPELLPVLRSSVVVDEENPAPEGISPTEIPSSGSAATDFSNAEAAARQLSLDHGSWSVNRVLRDHERELKKLIKTTDFAAKVKQVAADADLWLQNEGRQVWEASILFRGLGALYPNERALAALASFGLHEHSS